MEIKRTKDKENNLKKEKDGERGISKGTDRGIERWR